MLIQLKLANFSTKLSYFFVNTQMSDDLMKQLSSYKAQLQQVEVALSTDPENEDLLKLQKDLQVCVSVRIGCFVLDVYIRLLVKRISHGWNCI